MPDLALLYHQMSMYRNSVDDDIDTSFFNNDRRPSATVHPANRQTQPATPEVTQLTPTTMVVGYSHVSPCIPFVLAD